MPTETPNNPRTAYEAIAQALMLQHGEVSADRMFGMECLLTNRKLFALFQHDTMIFKLGGDAHRAALALPGAQVWHPPGRKQAMSRWVQIPFAHAPAWPQVAANSLAYASS